MEALKNKRQEDIVANIGIKMQTQTNLKSGLLQMIAA